MFSQPTPARSSSPGSRAYLQVGASTAVDGATPHKLVALLFAELLSEIARARGAIPRGDLVEKGMAIGHAVRIVEEGLIGPLDFNVGGEIAKNLNELYRYVVLRLTQANMRNDDAALAECQSLLAPIVDAWAQIEPSTRTPS